MSDGVNYRVEKDSMGEMRVPEEAYYGPQTQRAVENFPISNLKFTRPFISALGVIKRSAAVVNAKLGLLDSAMAKVIIQAAQEVEEGKLDQEFVVDIFQTGSGTSTNMNTNEVIARRATELSGGEFKVHPNDHVNMSQSSNDVIPTAIHISTYSEVKKSLVPKLQILEKALGEKVQEFKGLVKTGRTHLQDATPITLGQEFSGFQAQVAYSLERVERGLESIRELPLGGTAVGTGVNAHVEFPASVNAEIASRTGCDFIEARNHFEAQASKDGLLEFSGQLKTIACSLIKIANDIRWLGSGPRCGLGELALPAVQPGSSIMPGKVNPVICESVIMVGSQVIGNDAAVAAAINLGSTFQLNVCMPVIAHNILQSVSILASTAENFAGRCISGLKANTERLHELAEANIIAVTALAPIIGYDKAAGIAKEAFKTGESLRVVARRHQVVSDEELDKILDLEKMTHPGLS